MLTVVDFSLLIVSLVPILMLNISFLRINVLESGRKRGFLIVYEVLAENIGHSYMNLMNIHIQYQLPEFPRTLALFAPWYAQ